VIVVGQLTDSLGACVYLESVPDRRTGFRVRHHYAIEETDVREIVADCPVSDAHDGGRELGRVRHAERTANGDTWIVADVDSLDVHSGTDGRLYLSLEGRARDGMIDVSRVVLTHAPAQPLHPIKLVGPGMTADLDEAVILRLRKRDPFTAGLLERARRGVRERRAGMPVLRRDDDRMPAHGWIDYYGRPVAGPMHHGQPGRVLSVR
jgi:hypothetical protein